MSHSNILPFIDNKKQYKEISKKLKKDLIQVMEHGQFILGPEVARLEAKLKDFIGCLDAITVANGTDALTLSLMSNNLKPNEVVFVPEFTYCATAGAVARLAAIPYFVDIDPCTYTMCPLSLEKAIQDALSNNLIPKGVIAVDLFGISADYDSLQVILNKYDLWLIQDSAQSFGATYKNAKLGSFSPLVATSFYPTKPLGCYGDGGAIFVNNAEDAEMIRSLRVHGQGSHRYDHIHIGMNSRLDSMQAVVLLHKLELFEQEIQARRLLALAYNNLLDKAYVRQLIPNYTQSVYAQYTLLLPEGIDRKKWMDVVMSCGVPTMVYYPMLLSQQVAYSHFPTAMSRDSFSHQICQRIVALPMHGYMDEKSIEQVVYATDYALKICS